MDVRITTVTFSILRSSNKFVSNTFLPVDFILYFYLLSLTLFSLLFNRQLIGKTMSINSPTKFRWYLLAKVLFLFHFWEIVTKIFAINERTVGRERRISKMQKGRYYTIIYVRRWTRLYVIHRYIHTQTLHSFVRASLARFYFITSFN